MCVNLANTADMRQKLYRGDSAFEGKTRHCGHLARIISKLGVCTVAPRASTAEKVVTIQMWRQQQELSCQLKKLEPEVPWGDLHKLLELL